MPRKVLGGLRLAGCEVRRPHPINGQHRAKEEFRMALP